MDSNSKLKKGDRVCERSKWRYLKTGKQLYKTSKELNQKLKKGVVVSDRYTDEKPNRAGKKQPKYDVHWDGYPKPDPVYQSSLKLLVEDK